METAIVQKKSDVSAGFKSYYVVWKPSKKPPNFKYPLWFKSYYVVWKLQEEVKRKGKIVLFKSYYVVWKLLDLHPVPTTR